MIKQIRTKKESKQFIVNKGYNYFPDIFISKDNTKEIKEFINTYKSSLYIIRDGIRPQSKYYFFRTYEECFKYLDNYQDIVIIAVSVNAYKQNKIILGTIQLSSDNMISYTGSKNPECDHRTIFKENDFNLYCDIFDKRLNNIPEFDMIYAFLISEGLIDVVVEYTIYDIPVGVKKNRLVIQEIRNY